MDEKTPPADHPVEHGGQDTALVAEMYRDYFLDYASYVILERAVPDLSDGLKPVQRRILHAMKQLDDGRFQKVANLIGNTMQYHPHGDASIGDALVGLGQKNLLIETQGNWGNILTGDSAAAARYIEARLSRLSHEVVFNPKTTKWKRSYDGRNLEPVALPVKIPLLLAQGVEGIAVGLASKILPHNLVELLDAAIAYLSGQPFTLFPDFPTGGQCDASRYQSGMQGGKVRVRARIVKQDRKTLEIVDLPYGKNTTSLIDSIVSTSEKGKIRIRKVEDNTASKVSILLHLHGDVSADQTIDALYALTDCEVSISPNCCVIDQGHPVFLPVEELLRRSTDRTVSLLRQELEIRHQELEDAWHYASLEKIFIENRIYLTIEECETWEAILTAIDKGLEPFKPLLRRPVLEEDIVRLTEIRIKRISRYDSFKAEEKIVAMEREMETVTHHLTHLIPYAVAFYTRLREKLAPMGMRRTELRPFDTIEASRVAVPTHKLYVNREEGFVGTSLKKDEWVCDCTEMDDVIVFCRDGRYQISRVTEKAFFGKDIIHVGLFSKSDDRTVYNAVYRDGRNGPSYMKRFSVTSIVRDREYQMGLGANTEVLYLTANPNGEAEVVIVTLRPRPKLRKLSFDVDFGELGIKSRTSRGNLVSRFPVYRVRLKEKGVSTLGGRQIWYDPDVMRLNADGRGRLLGEFSGSDRMLVITHGGQIRTTDYDLNQRFEEDPLRIEPFVPDRVFTLAYRDDETGYPYLKRFVCPDSDRPTSIFPEENGFTLLALSAHPQPVVELTFEGKDAHRETLSVEAESFIAVKGIRAKGKRLTTHEWGSVSLAPLEPEPVDPADDKTPQGVGEGEGGAGETNGASSLEGEQPHKEPIQPSLFD